MTVMNMNKQITSLADGQKKRITIGFSFELIQTTVC